MANSLESPALLPCSAGGGCIGEIVRSYICSSGMLVCCKVRIWDCMKTFRIMRLSRSNPRTPSRRHCSSEVNVASVGAREGDLALMQQRAASAGAGRG